VRVLVTGAGGFVGQCVAGALADAGRPVLAGVHRSVPADLAARDAIDVLPFDLAAEDELDLAGRIDAVVHCAAALPSTVSDPAVLYRTNVNGMKRLLTAAVKAGAKRFVNCSSMSIYGRIAVPVVRVDTPSVEPDAYGRSKLDCEALLADTASSHGLAALSIRLPGIVGRGSHDNFLSNVMARILAGEPIQARNPDALFNNIVHVDDLTRFILGQLQSLDAGHRATTIAADEPLPIRQAMALLFATAGRPENIRYSEGGAPFLIDTEPARALGFAVPTTASSLRRFAEDCAA